MLADNVNIYSKSGSLDSTVHLDKASLYGLIDFIAAELRVWGKRSDRTKETAETILTDHLCAHLGSAARKSKGWDILQFRTEIPDENQKSRTIDLGPSPCGVTIIVDGKSFSDFDILLPIECKRLPTPKRKNRDVREYVTSRNSTTGGIQRFKHGLHGSKHSLGAMIAFIQDGAIQSWFDQVSSWIDDLISEENSIWSINDHLLKIDEKSESNFGVFHSNHERKTVGSKIELHHLWLII